MTSLLPHTHTCPPSSSRWSSRRGQVRCHIDTCPVLLQCTHRP
jgi:hypothetical protein